MQTIPDPIPTGQTISKKEQDTYNQYVTQMTPTHSLPLNMMKAFFTGGVICTIGQGFYNLARFLSVEEVQASTWASIGLIFLSVLLTGLNLFPSIAKWGGAGALVPITGFANSIAAPAIEFKKEGWIFGLGCKIFTISGPVILYGILTSWGLGILYWILKSVGLA